MQNPYKEDLLNTALNCFTQPDLLDRLLFLEKSGSSDEFLAESFTDTFYECEPEYIKEWFVKNHEWIYNCIMENGWYLHDYVITTCALCEAINENKDLIEKYLAWEKLNV